MFRRWKKKFVARATLCAEHGRTKETPTGTHPSHTSWWPAETLDAKRRALLFSVVAKVS